MKIKHLFLLCCVFLISCNSTSSKEKIIELSITYHNELGPLSSGMAGLGFHMPEKDSEEYNLYPQFKALYPGLTNVQTAYISVDHLQYLYQNYKAGNISEEYYNQSISYWGDNIKNKKFSDQPLKSIFGVMSGTDENGEKVYVLDRNSNLDFSDDEPYIIPVIGISEIMQKDSIEKYAVAIVYERLLNDEVVIEEVPFVMQLSPDYPDMPFYSFIQHGTVDFEGSKIGLISNTVSLDYYIVPIAIVPEDMNKEEKLYSDVYIAEKEYLTINDKIYQNLGVDRNRDILRLKKANQKKEDLESTQIGFKAFPFGGNNLVTGDTLSLADYTGKYIYVDFWSIGCGPCIRELPELRALYNKVDKSKVEFIGVLDKWSPLEWVHKRIDESQINWPQIKATPENDLEELYGIRGYPTTFLISPDGIIVAKNLRVKGLEEKLNELIGE